MAYDALVVLKASGTETTSTNATGFQADTTALRGMVAVATVTAVSGTSPVLALKIQESADNSTWNDVAAFDSITAKGVYKQAFASDKKYIRSISAISGTTPSFTYSVNVEL